MIQKVCSGMASSPLMAHLHVGLMSYQQLVTRVDFCSTPSHSSSGVDGAQLCPTVQDDKWVICWVKEFSDSAALERLMEE
jgi:hypothetical protein